MTLLESVLERELDEIIKEVYGENINEAKDDDDGAFATPIHRAASFPFRAMRYQKAKRVMNKYSGKILRKAERVISRFENELNKSIPQIRQRGEELQKQLDNARIKNDDTEEKSTINQQKKFKTEVEKNQEARVQNLNQSIDNLIDAYTTAINKRIDEPGYVLKVELSEKGKADLKFLWQEYVSIIKQKVYEKLIRIINNKNVKGLENLISRLEVEIEDAEDKRLVVRRSRGNIFKEEKKEYEKQKKERVEKKDQEKNPEKEKSEKKVSNFEEIKRFLDDNLPDGLLEEGEPYELLFKVDGKKPRYLDGYLEIDDAKEMITAVYYEEGETDDPVGNNEIESEEEAELFIKRVEDREEDKAEASKEGRVKKYESVLFNHLKNYFTGHEKEIRSLFSYEFFQEYKNSQKLKDFSLYVARELADRTNEYRSLVRSCENNNITDRQIKNVIIPDFKKDFEESEKLQNESFVSLKTYSKYKL